MVAFSFFLFLLVGSAFVTSQQFDTVLLDELLRKIVENSMIDLRQKLQDAIFAAAFRRRIHQASYEPKDSQQVIDKLLDNYMSKGVVDDEPTHQQKLSLSLETYTTTKKPAVTSPAVQIVTAAEVEQDPDENSENNAEATGRMFDDLERIDKEPPMFHISSASFKIPRIPSWIAYLVTFVFLISILLLIGSVVFYLSQQRRIKRQNRMERMTMMPDPLTVAGLCHSSDRINFGHMHSRRSSIIMDQDRAGSVIYST